MGGSDWGEQKVVFGGLGPGKEFIFSMGMSGLICRWEVVTGVVFGDLGGLGRILSLL